MAWAVAWAEEPIRIGVSERTYGKPLEALLTKAYASAGRQVVFVERPLMRALLEMRDGKMEATSARTQTFFDQNPDMLRVGPPIMTLMVYAFGRAPCPEALTPEQMKSARIAYSRGAMVLASLVPAGSRMPVNTGSDALLVMAQGGADFALLQTLPELADLPVQAPGPPICRVAKAVAEHPLFHGLHQSQAALAPALDKAIKGLRDHGEIQAAWASFERQLQASQTRAVIQPGRAVEFQAPASGPRRRPGP